MAATHLLQLQVGPFVLYILYFCVHGSIGGGNPEIDGSAYGHGVM